MAEEYVQMNVNVTAADLKAVDEMAKNDGTDNRSAVVRRLIRQEVIRLAPTVNLQRTLSGIEPLKGFDDANS
jgi:metal-responsive CopG/Arc/MetJ family transcriptional regulator